MQLKRFKIVISGLYCPVPRPDRTIQIDLEDTDEAFDNLDLFVVLHEISCKIKQQFPVKEMADLNEAFEKYHFGKDDKAPVMELRMVASGAFCSEEHPERKIIFEPRYNDGRHIGKRDVSVILYEILCNLRNQMSLTMSRRDMAEFAEKFKVYGLGMRSGEPSFQTRGTDDGVQKFTI